MIGVHTQRRRGRWLLRLLVFLGLVALVVAGGAWALAKFRPDLYARLYDQGRILEARYWNKGAEYKYEKVHPWYDRYDVDKLLRIATPEDIEKRRKLLIDVIWEGDGFPTLALPVKIELDVKDGLLGRVPGARRVDRYVSVQNTPLMQKGLPSHLLHVFAAGKSRKLVLYLQGHGGSFRKKGKPVVVALVAAGYDVLGIDMPLYTDNVKVDLPGLGPLWLSSHEDLEFVGRPMTFFFQPVAEGLNYALQKYDYERVYLIGFSGGGWTATVYAAIDPRVRRSYAVAGTYPVYLRRLPRDTWERTQSWGDFEQHWPPLLAAASYPEMYLMASHGANRQHMQILNKYDSCCFHGVGWKTYVETVTKRVSGLGAGKYVFVSDDSHASHKLSAFTLQRILDDIAAD